MCIRVCVSCICVWERKVQEAAPTGVCNAHMQPTSHSAILCSLSTRKQHEHKPSPRQAQLAGDRGLLIFTTHLFKHHTVATKKHMIPSPRQAQLAGDRGLLGDGAGAAGAAQK